MSEPQVITISAEWKKPQPSIDHDNEEFFEGLKQHKLLLWRCRECGAWYWPKAYCQRHDNQPYAENMGWVASSGRGRLFAFNKHHTAFHPGFRDEIPYWYALIELDEGPLISSQLVGDRRPKNIADVGQRVDVVFEDHPGEGFTLPKFRILD